MKIRALSLCLTGIFLTGIALAQDTVTYPGKSGPGKGKNIVFLAGDEEYRSEEGLPMLAKILSQRDGFNCTVVFSIDANGLINPNVQTNEPGVTALDTADAIVIMLRYRHWPDSQMKHFVDAVHRGVSIIGLRTATHAFQYPGGSDSEYKNLTSGSRTGFGKTILGETWVNHWGRHTQEGTRGIIEESAKNDPILHGVSDIFCDTDVYEAYPPADATILMRGQVVKGMHATDPAADYKKKRATGDRQEQGINDPMMPIAWTRINKNDNGTSNRVFCTTVGAATDLQNEGIRRMLINAVYWGLNMPVPEKADVAYVDEYNPSGYGNDMFRKNLHAADLSLGKSLPAATK